MKSLRFKEARKLEKQFVPSLVKKSSWTRKFIYFENWVSVSCRDNKSRINSLETLLLDAFNSVRDYPLFWFAKFRKGTNKRKNSIILISFEFQSWFIAIIILNNINISRYTYLLIFSNFSKNIFHRLLIYIHIFITLPLSLRTDIIST